MFLQLLVNGLQLGALYALTAVGFSLIFGSTKIFHFAHGATLTIAAYVFYELYAVLHWHWLAATLVCAAAAVVFGVLLDRLVYAPIQRHEGSFFTVFVAAFGVGILVQNIIGMVFGRAFVSIDSPQSQATREPPIFAVIMRRSRGVKVLECHVFVCKSTDAALAFVQSCTHAIQHSGNVLAHGGRIRTTATYS